MLLGQTEKAKEVLITFFLDGVEHCGYSNLEGFQKLKEQLEEDFARLGCEIPRSIQDMESPSDIHTIF